MQAGKINLGVSYCGICKSMTYDCVIYSGNVLSSTANTTLSLNLNNYSLVKSIDLLLSIDVAKLFLEMTWEFQT